VSALGSLSRGLRTMVWHASAGRRRRLAPLAATAAADRAPCVFGSGICKASDFRMPLFAYWCKALGETPRYHRKLWEYVFICQALHERGALVAGARGVGFGVGCEPLVALFAARGVAVLATDMDASAATAAGWLESNQHAGAELARLNARGLCDADVFARNVRYRTVDMKAVPRDVAGFDFCWSSCACEHLGSIDAGLVFLRESMRALRAGGIAVHTTEFNLSSPMRTIDDAPTVLFRRRDLERLAEGLRADGDELVAVDYTTGSEPIDRYVDLPPFDVDRHLRLEVHGRRLRRFVTTSLGLVAIKGAA
jgi:SAM-dependent methyltransferase